MEIDGRKIQKKVFKELQHDIELLWEQKEIRPCLGIIVVGQRKDSQTYVRMKKKACDKLNISYKEYSLSDDICEQDIIDHVNLLNNNKNVNGILIQLPLPKGINEHKVINTMLPDKDIEGMSDINMGKMLRNEKGFYNCTPVGCIRLLDEYNIPIEGSDITIIGCGKVGLPLSILLMQRHATVTMCDMKTKNPEDKCRNADIIISCAGKINLITERHINEHSIVLDVGINTNEEGKLEGDMPSHLKKCVKMASPVPGGVGPMTVSMLIYNLIKKTVEEYNLKQYKY